MPKGNKNPKRTFAKDRALASRAGKLSKTPSKGLMELRKVKERKLKVSESIVINIMIKAFEGGDHQRLEAILRRSIGPIKEKLEVSPSGHKSIIDEITGDSGE